MMAQIHTSCMHARLYVTTDFGQDYIMILTIKALLVKLKYFVGVEIGMEIWILVTG